MAQFAIDEILTTGIQISGFIFDRSNSIGASGQVLTSTPSGVMWQPDSSSADLAVLSGQIVATGTLLNNKINSLSGYVNQTFISGSGTQYYVPRWNTSKELVTGSIYDNGFVGIGITSPSGQLHLRNMGFTAQSGIPDTNSYPNATGIFGLVLDHDAYTNGQYRHRFIKVDRSANIPLYLQQAGGTANQYLNLVRFGAHSQSSDTFEVFGDSKINGTANIISNLLVSGNIGIGTASPSYKLDAIGSVRASGELISEGNNARISLFRLGGINYFDWASGQSLYFSTQSSVGGGGRSTLMTITSGGNVGIGTVTPNGRLHVVSPDSTYAFSVAGATKGVRFNINSAGTYIQGVDNTLAGSYQSLVLGGSDLYFQTNGLTNAMYISPSGNVGINSTSPTSKLNIVETTATGTRIQLGTSSESALMNSGSTNDLLILNAPYGFNAATTSNIGAKWGIKFIGAVDGNLNNNNKTSAIYAVSEDTLGYNRGTSLAFYTNQYNDITYAERMRIYHNGNIGIGTTTPEQKLHIASSAAFAAIKFSNSTNSAGIISYSADNLYLYTSNTQRLTIDTNGYVGIGTTIPIFQTEIFGTNQTTANITDAGNKGGMLVVRDLGSAANNGGVLGFSTSIASGTYIQAAIKSLLQDGNGYGRSHLAISLRSAIGDTFLTERVRILNDGSIGIGITNPSDKLHVAGSIRISGGEIVRWDGQGFIDTIGNNDLFFRPNQTFKMILTAAGRLGVGLTNPATLLGIGGNGSTSAASGLTFGNDSSANLYRSAASTIKTDGSLEVVGTATLGSTVVNGGTLATSPAGSTLVGFNYNVNVGSNISQLNLVETRFVTGADWLSASTKIQKRVDAVNMGYIEFNPSGGANGMAFGVGFATQTEAMRILSNGSIGIGITNPVSRLDVNGTISISGYPLADRFAVYNRLWNPELPSIYLGDSSDPSNYYDNTTHIFRARGAGVERMRITSAGNVGIGTVVASRRIHAYTATGPVMRLESSGSNASIEFAPSLAGNGLYNWLVGAQQNISNAFEITPSTAVNGTTFSNPALLITSAGNVGINSTAPTAKLSINKGSSSQLLALDIANNDAKYAFYVDQDNINSNSFSIWDATNSHTAIRYLPSSAGYWQIYTNNVERIRINSAGNVGIGITNPAVRLDVSGGNARFSDYIIVGEDLAYPSNTGSAYLGYSTSVSSGPQSNLELIDALSNAIGVNDPLRFKTTLSGQYFSGGNWYADPAPLSYRNLLDGNANAYLDLVTSSEYSVGISGKRFVVDLADYYRRPNFILLNTDWNQAFWGFKLNVENSNDLTSWANCITEQNFATNNTKGVIALSITDSIPGGISRYFRFSFVANQAISAGALRVNKIRSLGNQNYSSVIPVYTSSTGHLIASIGIISPTITSLSGNLAATGSTLDSKINSLSGYSNANFATITNLAATGSTLNNKINSLSGYANSTFVSGQGTLNWTARWNDTKQLTTGSIYDLGTGVGIGTISPVSLLSVGTNGSTTALNGISFGGDSTANLYRSAAGTLKTDGRLNIVGDATDATPDLFFNGAGGFGSAGGQVRAWSPDNTTLSWYWDNTQFTYNNFPVRIVNASSIVRVYLAPSSDSYINNSSNFGIGTNAPGTRLDVRFPTNPVNDNGAGNNVLRVWTTAGYAADVGGAIGLGGEYSGGLFQSFGQIAGRKTNSISGNNAGYLQFSTTNNGGTMNEWMRIDAGGNVGIGTVIPAGKLQVVQGDSNARYSTFNSNLGLLIKGNDNSAYNLLTLENTQTGTNYGASINFNLGYGGNANTAGTAVLGARIVAAAEQNFTSTASTQDGYLAFYTTLDGSSSEKVRLTSDGNVGIGLTSASARLHIMEPNGANDNVYQRWSYTNSVGTYDLLLKQTVTANVVRYNFSMINNSTTYLNVLVLDRGNVGLGTTNPNYQLTVIGANQATANITDAGNKGGSILVGSSLNTSNQGGSVLFATLNDNLNYTPQWAIKSLFLNGQGNGIGDLAFSSRLATGDSALSEVVRIKYDGKVGIGTDTPNSKLQVNGDTLIYANVAGAVNSNKLIFGSFANTNAAAIYSQTTSASAGDLILAPVVSSTITERVRVKSDGKVGIGTDSPAAKLEVSGSLIAGGVDNGAVIFYRNTNPGTIGSTDTVLLVTDRSNSDWGIMVDKGGYDYGLRIETANSATNAFAIYNGSIYSARIYGNGGGYFLNNVGVGTSSPATLLSVGGPGSTTAASGITFGADSIANIYRSSASELKTDGSFVVSNTLVVGGGGIGLRILKDGSDSISSTLYLANAANTRAYNFQQNAAGTNLALWTYNSANTWQNSVNFNYNGSVGIGTTAPSGKLHVVSTIASETVLRADGTNGTLFSVTDDLSDSLMSVNNSAGLPVLEVFADDRIVAGQYGSGDLVLINNKVGIGTTNPSFKLDVNGSLGINASTSDTNWPFVVSDNSSAGSRYSLNKLGSMGFNNADNYAQLQLLGSAGAYVDFTNSVGGDSNARLIYYAGNRLDLTYGFVTKGTISLNSNGIGIGTTSPVVALDVVGPIGSFPIAAGTTTTGVNLRLRNSDSNLVLDIGGNGGNGNWLQSTSRADLSLGYPLLLNPNGGNVGIGTTAPSYKLDVQKTSDGTIGYFRRIGATINPALAIYANESSNTVGLNTDYAGAVSPAITFSIASSEKVRIANDGNVGIGTIAPTGVLTIHSNGTQLRLQTASGPGAYFANISSVYDSSHPFTIAVANNSASATEFFGIYADGGGANNRAVFPNGNVGIGLTNPSAKLHVTGSNGDEVQIGTIGSAQIVGGRTGGSFSILTKSTSNGNLILAANAAMYLRTNTSNESLYIAANGNVGINTTSPVQKFQIDGIVGNPALGGITQTGIARISNTTDNATLDFGIRAGGNGAWLQSTDETDLSAYYPLLLNPNGGNVGVGTTAPLTVLDVRYKNTSNAASQVAGMTLRTNQNGGLEWHLNQTSTSYVGWVAGARVNAYGGNWGQGYLEFITAGAAGNISSTMTLNSGQVGIGITNPTTLLNVGGAGSTIAASGLTFGADTSANLYRSAASTIKTDGSLVVNGNFSTNTTTVTTLNINAGLLPGIPAGSTITGFTYAVNNGNVSQINLVETRFATGSDWTTASTKIQKRTDVTNQAYIEFNPSGSTYGIAFGVGVGNTEAMRIASNGTIGIGVTSTSYKLQVNGSFAATTKSFDIVHPTISGKRLTYASLEGPENGVYYRGQNNNNEINLPHYWSGLVHDDSITVNLTAVGRRKDGKIRNYSVDQIGHNKVYIYTDSDDNIYNYYYTIFAERKDVSKLVIERDME